MFAKLAQAGNPLDPVGGFGGCPRLRLRPNGLDKGGLDQPPRHNRHSGKREIEETHERLYHSGVSGGKTLTPFPGIKRRRGNKSPPPPLCLADAEYRRFQTLHDKRKELVDCIPRLRRFALALAGNQPDADDLVQSAVEKALRNLGGFQNGTRMDSWLFKITQNLWIDSRRSHKRRGGQTTLNDAMHIAGEDGRKLVEERAMIEHTRAAIASLPEEQRLAVAYVLVEGQSYKDAAHNLGVPVGTVMSRLSRARKALAAQVLG
ncbi:MAG: RNA polymerase sigma factor [Amphiplicatus sp.]